MRFMLLALTPWNLNWFSQFFHRCSHSEHLFICKKIKSAANWKNFFRSSLPAVQFVSVSSCARRLLKHFSCRSFRIMRTTDDLGMPVFRDISRTVLWVRAVPPDSEPYRSPGECFHSRGTSRSVVALTSVHCARHCSCLWTSLATC